MRQVLECLWVIVIIQSEWLVLVVSECCISKKILATKLFYLGI